MEIRFSKRFEKQYQKLSKKNRNKFWERLELWKTEPYHPLLKHHVLSGKLAGLHSINITADLRAIYRVVNDTIYIYELIGTHSQLYG
ncbi:TPA: hypothetical protein DIS56_03265 [Candidatus Saccharibacteria bacterium]|nr:MAG: hypothetical protein A3F05_01160 [Candidatus Saccharibacteria bacterium RIFCSPHIGHO2_12_FULL_47_17]HCM52121.1 hypothetical protein [Candidatus Saccharibacteria bacterium]